MKKSLDGAKIQQPHKKFKTIKTINISNVIDPGDIMGVKKAKKFKYISSF